MAAITTFDVVGYGQGLQTGIPVTNDFGGKQTAGMSNAKVGLPPVIWMLVFLVVGYIGLRMLLKK